jgi:hypothetical protein
MKNTLVIAPWIAIVVILIWFTQCQKQPKCPEVVNTSDTITQVDTVTVTGQTVYYPSPYEIIHHDTAYRTVDTAKIVSNYLDENKYKLLIVDDTNARIELFATVQYNLLKEYRTDAVYYPHTKTITNTEYITTPKRNKMLGGLILSGNAQSFGAAPVLGLKTKKDNIFLAGYDVLNGTIQVGYMAKIGRR